MRDVVDALRSRKISTVEAEALIECPLTGGRNVRLSGRKGALADRQHRSQAVWYSLSNVSWFAHLITLLAGLPARRSTHGVAFGRFIPAEGFDLFLQTVPPDITDGDQLLIWNYLAATASDGVVLGCAGVGLRYDPKHEFSCEVEVLGITSPHCQDMFPHHVEAYELLGQS